MTTSGAIHQCLFCPQTFGSAAEKDDHTLEHFSREICTECNQNLIRIGGNLFTQHNEVTCIKRELKTELHFETCYVEQPPLPNDQQNGFVDFHSTSSGTIIGEEIQIKAEVESERYSEGLQNKSKTTNTLETMGKHHECIETPKADQSDDDEQLMNDDFALDSMCSEELNSETESFTQHKQPNCATHLNELEENQHHEVNPQLPKQESVDILQTQLKECRVLLTPGVHFCKFCSKTFATLDKLTEHQSECFETLEGVHSNIDNQNQIQKKSSQYPCNKCGKLYAYAGSLYKHTLSKHSPPGTRVCSTCTKVFSTEDELTNHRAVCLLKRKNRIKNAIEANASFECYLCKASRKSILSLFAHMRWTHQPNGVKYKCNICEMPFFTKSLLEIHQKRHNQSINDRKLMCSVCGVYVKKSDTLKAHMLIHTGEKPFQCTHVGCDKLFRSKSQMLVHQRSHTKEKPFHCTIDNCGQRFSYSADFRRHKFKIHGIFTKKLPCSVCGEIYPEIYLLKQHMRKKHANQT